VRSSPAYRRPPQSTQPASSRVSPRGKYQNPRFFVCLSAAAITEEIRKWFVRFWIETSMGAIPFGSITELRYGSDVVALFLPG
jgi:hypothetical protein